MLGLDRAALARGARAALPLTVPTIPFGVALGILIADHAPEVPLAPMWAANWILYAGSAQLMIVQLLAQGSAPAAVIAAVVMINARHVVYSAAVNQRLGPVPSWFRLLGSYWLSDQVFAVEDASPRDMSTRDRMAIIIGAGATLWTLWNLAVIVGIFGGGILPEDFPTGLLVALLFAGLMVLAIRDRAGIVAAVVGGAVAMAARGLPPGTGVVAAVIFGALAGAAAAGLDRRPGPPVQRSSAP